MGTIAAVSAFQDGDTSYDIALARRNVSCSKPEGAKVLCVLRTKFEVPSFGNHHHEK